MEIRDIFLILKKNFRTLVILLIAGVISGILFYLIPKKFYTSGTLYITRKIEKDSPEFFKYEGYYAQQTSISNTESVIALFESTDIQAKTIEKMNLKINKINLLKFKRNLNVKKLGPQVINITVKDKSPESSYQNWENLVNLTIKNVEDINSSFGDSNIKINKINEPITTQNYYPLEICVSVGALLSILIYLIISVSLNYQKYNK